MPLNISQKANTTIPQLSAQDAISKASAHFGLAAPINLELIDGTNSKNLLFNGGGISQENIPTKLVFLSKDDKLILTWDLSILTLDGNHWWSVRLDAVSGKVLDVSDWILRCKFGDSSTLNHNHDVKKSTHTTSNFNLFKPTTSVMTDGSQYNVYALPVESPNHGSRQLVSEPANLAASPYGWHDDDGAAGAEYTITRGNNVWAQLDDDGNDGTGYSPDGAGSLNFNFALDFNQQPSGYQDAAITNLFYMNNMMHDIWFQYGFDEAAGNFQEKNYGAPFFEGGVNNANFGTPPDGGNPRMQMFLWEDSFGGQPLTINNGALAGDYSGTEANFGDQLPTTPLTADLGLMVDDDSTPTSSDPNDGCDTITLPVIAQLQGKIVVIRRGDCEFGFKVLNAENAGAIAVIIVNNVADPEYIFMGGGAVGDSVTIPSILVSQTDGEAIIASLINGDTINASLVLPNRIDGDFDNGIIAHEYGHGISNRLTGGAATTNCLNNSEQMGEGWSDWFGLMVTMESSDLGTDGRGVGTFANAEDTDGVGIRTKKYSTDFAINDFTFADSNTQVAPHGLGSVWCTMLWDLTWAYIDKYGFDSDILNGTGGNNKVMQLVIDGLKLQPCGPGFVEGRDAILAADIALTGGEDQCLIWTVFANRGLGINADSGFEFLATDQVEDFTLPDPDDASLANCTSALDAKEFDTEDYKIYPNPSSNKLFIKTSKSIGDVVLTLSDINGRTVKSQKAMLQGEVEMDISTLQSGIYILNIKGEFISTNAKIVKN
jgi:hypothetical protein